MDGVWKQGTKENFCNEEEEKDWRRIHNENFTICALNTI
jgi:hypothetical protein